jgi:hypothetical protein
MHFLLAAAQETNQISMWLLGVLATIVIAFLGAGAKSLLDRMSRTEDTQRIDEGAAALVAGRVSVVEADVKWLKDGRLVVDVRLGMNIQEQVAKEVAKQTGSPREDIVAGAIAGVEKQMGKEIAAGLQKKEN